MIRQNIILGQHTYLTDLYKGDSDLNYSCRSKFVMIRKYSIINDISFDSDIYFVEKSVLKDVLDGKAIIAYPYISNNGTSNKFSAFSDIVTDFNSDIYDFNFKLDSPSTVIYNLYNKDLSEADIVCDKIRIYHPHTKVRQDMIIYVDNYINNIHFHYFCRPISELSSHAETQFNVGNNIYGEYVEIKVPTIEHLFSKSIYYKEDINMIALNNSDWLDCYKDLIIPTINKTPYTPDIVKVHLNQTEYELLTPLQQSYCVKEYDGSNKWTSFWIYDYYKYLPKSEFFVSLYLLLIPFKVGQDGNNTFMKVFLPEIEKTISNNYLVYPLNITLFPYDRVDTNTHMYLMCNDMEANSDTFTKELRFILSSGLGFNNGKIAVINKFIYPRSDVFPTFKSAYEYYNNVSFSDYEGIVLDEDDEDYDDDYNGEEQKQCGFRVIIASDVNLQQIIFTQVYESNDADDFSFDLIDLFSSWDQLPELLVCKTQFIDKYLGNVINGNLVVITKEWFKYMVNNSYTPRVNHLVDKQELEYPQLHIDDIYKTYKKDSDMNLNNFNFIDKINCIIEKKGEETVVHNNAITPRILYRPIFYRTHDLQNIKLKPGMKQNIGINLCEYMTKVEEFKLKIENKYIPEYARNDVFAIFQIDTSYLETVQGQYHILDQDDEYISSGNYSVS